MKGKEECKEKGKKKRKGKEEKKEEVNTGSYRSEGPRASCPVKCVMNFDDFRLNNINMQKFQHAHWPRARQLFPNSAGKLNFF